jgi:hypothetical protein
VWPTIGVKTMTDGELAFLCGFDTRAAPARFIPAFK